MYIFAIIFLWFFFLQNVRVITALCIQYSQDHFRKRMEEQKSPQERISMILEKESELTALQLNAASYSREIRFLKEQNK